MLASLLGETIFHLCADNTQEHVEQTIATFFFFFDCCIVCAFFVFNRNYECGKPFQPLTKKFSETIKADFFFFPLWLDWGKSLPKHLLIP